MKNDLFWIVAAGLYIVVLVLLVRKALDIFRNPEKYDQIKGWERYRSSFWYEPLSEYNSRFFSKNYTAPLLVFLPLDLGLTTAYLLLVPVIQKHLFVPAGGTYLHGEGRWLGGCAMVFYAIELSVWLVYHSSRPIAIACSRSAFSSEKRSGDWKKLICGLLIASVLCLPVMFAGIDTYAYTTGEGLAVNKFFQLRETAVSYEEIERVETRYSPYKDESNYNFSYIITVNGEETDLWNFCKPEELVEIHRQIEENGVQIREAVVSRKTYTNMEEVLEESELAMVSVLFEIS